jgi:hypothetical protein
VVFKGQIQQNFVVLHDSHSPSFAPWIKKPQGAIAKGCKGKQTKRKLVSVGEGGVTETLRKKYATKKYIKVETWRCEREIY